MSNSKHSETKNFAINVKSWSILLRRSTMANYIPLLRDDERQTLSNFEATICNIQTTSLINQFIVKQLIMIKYPRCYPHFLLTLIQPDDQPHGSYFVSTCDQESMSFVSQNMSLILVTISTSINIEIFIDCLKLSNTLELKFETNLRGATSTKLGSTTIPRRTPSVSNVGS